MKMANDVKNNVGIIYKLGYELKIANPQKIITMLRSGVREKKVTLPNSVKKQGSSTVLIKEQESIVKEVITLNDETNPEGISHQEFRLGVLLLLPLIDPKAEKSPKDQLSRDPLDVRNKDVLEFYNKNKDVVNALNLAYASRVTIGRKGSKATPSNFIVAKGHAANLSAGREWMDANGDKYSSIEEVPKHVRDFLLSFLRRKIGKEKPLPKDKLEEETNSSPDTGVGVKQLA